MLVEDCRLADAAPAQAVAALRERFPGLPDDYFAFLARHNGGEGSLEIDPGWVQLWPAESVAEFSGGYGLANFLPGYTAIGSSGGGELFVFASAGAPPGLFMVPAIGMSPETVTPVAPSFVHFTAAFGKEWSEHA
jgi:hypothetical protein